MRGHEVSERIVVLQNGDCFESHQCAYAVIQTAAQLDRASLPVDLDTQVIVPEPFRAQPELFPVLLGLKGLDAKQRTHLFEYATAWELDANVPYFSALLDSASSGALIAAHLARRMVVFRPDGGQDVLRFYDPLVFRHLRWLFTSKQLDSLLGPIQGWNWREPNGTWRSYRREAAHASVPPLLLKPDQWPTLERLGEINLTLNHLARVAPELSNDDLLARRIDMLLADASLQHRMENRLDRCLYVEQAVRFHLHIHAHPKLRRRLEAAQTGALSYTSACADLDAATLREFSSQLQSRNLVKE